jgi:hypothetical protein
MLCCVDCFNDSYLKKIIQEEGQLGNCDYCESKSKYCIHPEDLADYFRPLVDLYTPVEDFMPLHDLKEGHGEFIWEKLQDDWDVFAFYDYEKQEDLLNEMFPMEDPKEGIPMFLSSLVERQCEYWGSEDEVSNKMESRWREFSKELKYSNRFFPQKQFDLEWLSDLFSFFEFSIYPNSYLYRARILKEGKKFPPAKMGMPPIQKTKNSRANPKGIPYLYLTSDHETAISETRPPLKANITVGTFKVIEPIRIIDLRSPRIESPFRLGDSLEYLINHLGFLRILGTELSKPVDPIAEELQYLPSQYLCEFIKNEEYDGVAYKSSIADGFNIALFTDTKVKCTRTKMYHVKKVKYLI